MSSENGSRYDIIVAGLGAAGSALCWQLARAGARVLGLAEHAWPHDHGSSHGESRVTRLAIGEGAEYSALAIRSHQIWREAESQTGRDLLRECGCLIMSGGAQEAHGRSDFLDETIRAATAHGIAFQMMDSAAIGRAYPAFSLEGGETGYFEPTGGYLRCEDCVSANLELAAKAGAALRYGEAVLEARPIEGGMEVRTARGTYTADQLALSVGTAIKRFLPPAQASLFKVFRQTLYWFNTPAMHDFSERCFPVFIWLGENPASMVYGFPAIGRGLKIAGEQFEREGFELPSLAEEAAMDARMTAMFERRLPCLGGAAFTKRKCLYTCAPGSRFLIDRHPEWQRAFVISACSGHGFKHSAAIGEAVAAILSGGRATIDLSPFSWGALPS